jgi:hypothetical protein
MSPKTRGLAQHGSPPGWLEESDPAGCDFVRNGRSMLPALTDYTTHRSAHIESVAMSKQGLTVMFCKCHST